MNYFRLRTNDGNARYTTQWQKSLVSHKAIPGDKNHGKVRQGF
ncbi:hypothetical protein [Iningainema tapete]|nr:hypothetical protein [Iningainema tapete]